MPLATIDVATTLRLGDTAPFDWSRSSRRGWRANVGNGLLGLDGELDEDTFDALLDEPATEAPPAQGIPAAKTKKQKKKAAKVRKQSRFAAKRAADPRYRITAGGLVSQKGGVTARAHIEDQLYNRGERARRTVRDRGEELRKRAAEKKAALFDAEQRRQKAIADAQRALAEEQTKTALAQREAQFAQQQVEFAKRVDPNAEREFVDDLVSDDPLDFDIDVDAEEAEYLDDGAIDELDDSALELEDLDVEAMEGTAGFFDVFKKIIPAAASFIPGVGPIVGAVTGAALATKGGKTAAAIDPNAQQVTTQSGAPAFQVQLENVGKVLIDALGRVIAKKTGGKFEPIAEPKPVAKFIAEKEAKRGGSGASSLTVSLPMLAVGGIALALLLRKK